VIVAVYAPGGNGHHRARIPNPHARGRRATLARDVARNHALIATPKKLGLSIE